MELLVLQGLWMVIPGRQHGNGLPVEGQQLVTVSPGPDLAQQVSDRRAGTAGRHEAPAALVGGDEAVLDLFGTEAGQQRQEGPDRPRLVLQHVEAQADAVALENRLQLLFPFQQLLANGSVGMLTQLPP